MRIKRKCLQCLTGILLLAFLVSAIMAAPGATSDSPYRLKTSGSQTLPHDASDIYRLDRKYRPPEKPVSGPVKIATSIEHPLADSLADQPYSKEIAKAAMAAELDPALVHAIIFVESGYRHSAISNKGAIGLMQVLPDTAARYGIRNPKMSPQANLRVGTLYLRDLIRTFDNRLDLALAAYNAGEGSVQRYSNRIPPYPETQQYVHDVLAKYNEWRNAAAIEKNRLRIAQERPKEKSIPTENSVKQEIGTYLTGTRLAGPIPTPTNND